MRAEERKLRKSVRFLLCSAGGSDVCGRALQDILEEASDYGPRLIESIDASQLEGRRASGPASMADPDVIFVLLTAEESEQIVPVFQALHGRYGGCPVVAVAEGFSSNQLYSLLSLGASEFFSAPLRATEVQPRVRRLLEQTSREDALVRQLKERLGLKQLIGESAALLAQIEKIPLLARSEASVLIAGETGTGKEMFAKAIHFLSPRAGKPFSAINCGAIPVELVENELFGHDPEAFTGATSSALGIIREAEGGTLFLDEVDSLPAMAQVKLLRFLQEKEFRPLGTRKPCRADVRVIAASNRNLEAAVKDGRFRQDLYYRLNVIGLVLPPLRARKDDIPLLAGHFALKYSTTGSVKELTPGALRKLMLYDWPGNVRELENVIQRSIILSARTVIGPEDLDLPAGLDAREGESFQELKSKLIADFERGYIQELLRAHKGNITKAAQAACKDRRAFWELMRKHRMTGGPPACANSCALE